MTPEEFQTLMNKKSDYNSPPSISGEEGLNILIKHFLGEDWYSVGLIHTGQVNYEAIHEILKQYPGHNRKFGVIEFLKHLQKQK